MSTSWAHLFLPLKFRLAAAGFALELHDVKDMEKRA